ncbi:hypothetical protein K438DRAFT_1760058 [Mycena galopus ATCC 62051]|nr:hypothetical protein K438DRAFT_1760058 [Mycena galopus ATCC 62051]
MPQPAEKVQHLQNMKYVHQLSRPAVYPRVFGFTKTGTRTPTRADPTRKPAGLTRTRAQPYARSWLDRNTEVTFDAAIQQGFPRPLRRRSSILWKEYQQAQRDWDDKWGANMLPMTARPYPLQPGGADLGASGCWTCGKDDGHFSRDCTVPEADCLPPKEVYWRQVNQPQNRPPAAPKAPVTLRSCAYPNTPSGFVTPPRAPGTPTPAFRRPPPPHFGQNNILMLMDAQGGYYGV